MNSESWNKFHDSLTLFFEYHDFERIIFTPTSLWTLTLGELFVCIIYNIFLVIPPSVANLRVQWF